MRLQKNTGRAVMLVTLVSQQNKGCTVKELYQKLPYDNGEIDEIFRKLSNTSILYISDDGFVKLRFSPKVISLFDIIVAMEGEFTINVVDESDGFPYDISGMLDGVQNVMDRWLMAMTVSDFTSMLSGKTSVKKTSLKKA